MRLTKRVAVLSVSALLAGCSAYNTEPKSILLPTSNRNIDLVQHRSDVRLMDCGTLVVLQTYSSTGTLIDSKEARGNAFHCAVVPALIEAGGRVGGAYVGRSGVSVRQSQAQAQNNTNTNTNTNTPIEGAGGGEGGNCEGNSNCEPGDSNAD